eukprot:20567_1
MGTTFTLKVMSIIISAHVSAIHSETFSCQTRQLYHYYGSAIAQCEIHQTYCQAYPNERMVWRYNFTIQGIAGPTKTGESIGGVTNTDVRDAALIAFFDAHHDNISCNCFVDESSTVDRCHITTKVCFRLTSLSQYGLNYETWITDHSYTGHYCCDHHRDVSKSMALHDLQAKNPGCFTPNPTHAPTSSPTRLPSDTPTADPTIHPTLQNCPNCILLKGQQCLGGYQTYKENENYCQPCPQGTAGANGMCSSCKDDQEPTFDRISCELKSLHSGPSLKERGTNVLWEVISGVLGGVCLAILVGWCWKKKKCFSKKIQQTICPRRRGYNAVSSIEIEEQHDITIDEKEDEVDRTNNVPLDIVASRHEVNHIDMRNVTIDEQDVLSGQKISCK